MLSKNKISDLIQIPDNPFHPLVYVGGRPEFGKNIYVGMFSEINGKGARIKIGDNCDIASFVSINVADSHKKAIGLMTDIVRKDIIIENDVFIGSHSFIGGGVHIGHHSVVAAGTIISRACKIPPYSLVVGNPPIIKKSYYKKSND